MFVEIRTRNLSVDPAVEAELQDHVSLALTRFGPFIDRVLVRLDDVNGPRGGIDKVCRTTVSLKGGGIVVSEGRSAAVRKALAASVVRARAQLRSRAEKRARGPRLTTAAKIAS